LKAATPDALAVPQALAHAESVGLHASTQLKMARHEPFSAQVSACEQHVLVRHVFWHASVDVNPPHCSPLSEVENPQAVPQGPLRQFERAPSRVFPVG
jgi:hypothetical protein